MPAFDEQQYRAERWRKTKGRNELRSVRQLTALRNLWFERDKLAQKKDIDSKRLLSDAALVAAAKNKPPPRKQIVSFRAYLCCSVSYCTPQRRILTPLGRALLRRDAYYRCASNPGAEAPRSSFRRVFL